MKEIAFEQLSLNPGLFPSPGAHAEREVNKMFLDIPMYHSGIFSEHLGNPQRTF